MARADMKKWLERQQHLPSFMRDFHNQKDLFKFIDSIYSKSKLIPGSTPINWVDAHIYIIDFFLWLMAKRGWTLQRSRKKLNFSDIEQDIEEYQKEYRNMFKNSPID
jgi:hypothetical protein